MQFLVTLRVEQTEADQAMFCTYYTLLLLMKVIRERRI